MAFSYKKSLKDLEGQEVWTNAYGERECVGICPDGKISRAGKEKEPTPRQAKSIFNDLMEQELGPRHRVQAELDEEFGGKY